MLTEWYIILTGMPKCTSLNKKDKHENCSDPISVDPISPLLTTAASRPRPPGGSYELLYFVIYGMFIMFGFFCAMFIDSCVCLFVFYPGTHTRVHLRTSEHIWGPHKPTPPPNIRFKYSYYS